MNWVFKPDRHSFVLKWLIQVTSRIVWKDWVKQRKSHSETEARLTQSRPSIVTNSVTGKTFSTEEELKGKGRQIGQEMAVSLWRKGWRGWNTRGRGLVWICMHRGDKSASRLNWTVKRGENDVTQRLTRFFSSAPRSKPGISDVLWSRILP